ncbi:neutral zinc metallopeptidase [Actinomadura macrotermitis]|uniref:Metalloprotease n=1 Tax=Actinomadura macrotermitis TaxID=2585200 RepID=A0A7K0BZL7_9ACTN|nr:neutral zinc metallopeptidase [Actinomadura macrotermitis]MQY06635.1 hypothetical protein [Actinomadura macrotermitis]
MARRAIAAACAAALLSGGVTACAGAGPDTALPGAAGCGMLPPRRPAAPPGGRGAARDNPVYRGGPMCLPDCDFGPGPDGGLSGATRYLGHVAHCLDVGWGRLFAAVGLRYRPPKVRIVPIRDRGRLGCGAGMVQAAGLYCPGSDEVIVSVGRDWYGPGYEPSMVLLLAHEYGHHVQRSLHIAQYAYTAGGEVERRAELQAECFGGVFLAAVRARFDQTDEWWAGFVDTESQPGDIAERHSHGDFASRRRWLGAGLRSGRPGDCRTWTAPSSEVAG